MIAALKLDDPARCDRVLSPRIAVGKILLTLLGLAAAPRSGARGRRCRSGPRIDARRAGGGWRRAGSSLQRALVLAGGAAGIAAAFNTPLAGVVFAIEELSHSFESRTSGTVLTAVILGRRRARWRLVGNYTYFGGRAALDFGAGWIAVALCALAGGLLGGLFSALLVRGRRGPARAGGAVADAPPDRVRRAAAGWRSPVLGLALAAARPTAPAMRRRAGWWRARTCLAGSFAVMKLARHRGLLHQRHPGRHLRAVAVGRRRARRRGWRSLLPARRWARSVLLGMVGISPAWCRRRSRRRSS